jgi:hypothetical protein
VKRENDEEGLPVVSVVCSKLDSKGKKTEEEVELDKKKIRGVKNRFEVQVKIHMPNGESMES